MWVVWMIAMSLWGWFSWLMGSKWRAAQEAAKLVKRAADLRGEAVLPGRQTEMLLARAFEAERAALVISGEVVEGGRR